MAEQPNTIHLPEGITVGTLTVNATTERVAADQGVGRLAMLDFLRGKAGPWAGADTEHWVRYRGHHVERFTNDPSGARFRLVYQDSAGATTADTFHVRTTAIALLRDLDDVLDVVLDQWPLEGREASSEAADLPGVIAELGMNHAAIHTAWVNGHADWLRELVLEQTRRVDDLIRAGVVERSAVFPDRSAS